MSFRLPALLAAELGKLDGRRTEHIVAAIHSYLAGRVQAPGPEIHKWGDAVWGGVSTACGRGKSHAV
jgi:hypothetical protein